MVPLNRNKEKQPKGAAVARLFTFFCGSPGVVGAASEPPVPVGNDVLMRIDGRVGATAPVARAIGMMFVIGTTINRAREIAPLT
jgi:Zn-dependent protease